MRKKNHRVVSKMSSFVGRVSIETPSSGNLRKEQEKTRRLRWQQMDRSPLPLGWMTFQPWNYQPQHPWMNVNPLSTRWGWISTPIWKNRLFNSKFFQFFQKKFGIKITLDTNMILFLHLVCHLCILELHLLNYDCISKGSENHLKRHGTERVK